MHVRKGDTVEVLSGNDRGKRGVVQRSIPDRERVVVEGVNLRWKHRKPSQKNPKGERVQVEVAIHASNVRRVEAAAEEARPAKKPSRKKKEGS